MSDAVNRNVERQAAGIVRRHFHDDVVVVPAVGANRIVGDRRIGTVQEFHRAFTRAEVVALDGDVRTDRAGIRNDGGDVRLRRGRVIMQNEVALVEVMPFAKTVTG